MKLLFRSLGVVITAFLLFSPHSAQTVSSVENEIVRHLDNISKFGNYGGTSDDDKVYAENRELRKKLVRYGKRSDVLMYSFPKLKGKMQVSTSRDGNLRIYSWDEETGGTMHDHDSVFQYRGSNGKVFSWAVTDDESNQDVGAFYHDIFQLSTGKGTVYLAVSTFVASTSLAGQSIKVLRIQSNRLERDTKLIRTASGLQNSINFQYDFFSVVDRPERPVKLFTFNAARKEFKFPVVIEDEKTPQGRVTNNFITYRFNGTHFVKVN